MTFEWGGLSLITDDGMSVVRHMTENSEAESNLLDRTTKAEDSNKNENRNFLQGVISFDTGHHNVTYWKHNISVCSTLSLAQRNLTYIFQKVETMNRIKSAILLLTCSKGFGLEKIRILMFICMTFTVLRMLNIFSIEIDITDFKRIFSILF